MVTAAPTRERFTRDQVRRILRLGDRQLNNWEREGFIQPNVLVSRPAEALSGQPKGDSSETSNGKRRGRGGTTGSKPRAIRPANFYTFSDIVALRTLIELRKSGVAPARLRAAHTSLKRRLANIEKPWSELQITRRGKHLVVQFQGLTMEALTGQLFLEYSSARSGSIPSEPIRLPKLPKQRERTPDEKRAKAERFFMAGLRYEEKGDAEKDAIRCYKKAIAFNPEASGAYINLGTIYYNLGDLKAAEQSYLAALKIDPSYVLVHFNLGNVADEQNDLAKARGHYEHALQRDPTYPDPHYNLAMVYEKLGLHGKARRQWLEYLKLDKTSQWAAYARRQLEKTPLKLVRKLSGETPE